ncbi:aminoacyl-tRNA hydrolase [Corynebacterium sp.]|uniref:aminoacyl-tRNA hydrolase n=1 Tax=Corynebacterium sp. TaxID=1720 RepID=UPI0025C29B19|nr:aminoacyl-tRNA hydrolase [Corynebacterium sp.]
MNSTDRSPFLVVGLGNPGAQYEGTRHNVGAMVLDELTGHCGGPAGPPSFTTNRKLNARVAETRIGDRRVILAVPRSFMNLSGGPVKALASYYRVPADSVVVVHDELDLDPGVVKLKTGGGLNSHNGLRDIAKSLGTRDFRRVQVGIGRPPGRMAPASYVLKPFSKSERTELPITLADAAELIVDLAVDSAS